VSEFFRFIHITDLHFCRVPLRRNAQYLVTRDAQNKLDTLSKAWSLGFASLLLPTSYIPDVAKGVAQFCLEWRDAADAIVITGDLATTAIPTDLAVALAFVKDPATDSFMSDSRMPTLSASGLPVYVMADNHDRYRSNSAAPGSNLFDLTFADYLRSESQYVGWWISEKGEEKLGFVYADFSLRERVDAEFLGPIFAYGQGRVYQDILNDMKTQTHAIWQKNGRIPVVWLIHFAPFTCETQLKLIDFPKLNQAAGELGHVVWPHSQN
jgi:Calcineurin-like phosphoesterase